MSVAIWCIATLIVLGALLYHRVSLRTFTLVSLFYSRLAP